MRGTLPAILPLLGLLVVCDGSLPIVAHHLHAPDSVRRDVVQSPTITIDLDEAVNVQIPDAACLTPVVFRTPDGKRGWAVRIPGNRPIATPCFADGMLFVGGGYGSHDFHAFDASTGESIWSIKTSDDGPTAAVEEDGYVAFNTESCTVIVVEAKSGGLVWQEWLGDPLMSQPAVSQGRLFIAHPVSGRPHTDQSPNSIPHGNLPGTLLPLPNARRYDSVVGGSGSHRMLCADLRTGAHRWSYAIPGDVITAPVVDGNRLYFTCFNGTSYCLDVETGAQMWSEENAGTSAPLIVNGQAIFTSKDEGGQTVAEGIMIADTARGKAVRPDMLAVGDAAHLQRNQGGGVGINKEAQSALDGSVGFASAPSTANLDAANNHIGVSTVVGAWAYQGARTSYSKGRLMNAQGMYLNSVDAERGEIRWRVAARGGPIKDRGQTFLPPAVGGENMYVATTLGHLVSIRSHDGSVRFQYNIHHPIVFQPALANGNMYVGTADGWLICLQLDDTDADGWYAWGGNGAHNKSN